MAFMNNLKKKLYLVAARYFKFFANISLKRWRPRIIMITGSAGKTTMLNLIESQLGNKAHYSHDANSAFGIAFDVLGQKGVTGSRLHWLGLLFKTPFLAFTYTRHEKYYIVECDGERPHEAEFVAKWLKPEVSLWVSLGRSHAVFYEKEVKNGNFANIDEAIAHEFATIPENTRKFVLIDGDNETIVEKCKNLKAEVVAVQKKQLTSYEVYPDHTIFTIGRRKYEFKEPVPRDVTTQLLMLDKLMDYLGIKASTDLSNFRMPPARSNFLHGKNGLKIIDSSYNAHIISMTTVLEMVRELHTSHKWLVIGDIIDQGQLEGEEHKKLAQLLLDTKVEKIVMIGRRTKQYTAPLLKDKCDFKSFAKPQAALKYLEANLTGKETVIFKGSQYLEWIIEKLLENPDDVEKLARQDAAHKKRRASWGLN
jgi:UDP-N-acetylmuramoyl-tripeptide--D-alanyl-D-alanine ligase